MGSLFFFYALGQSSQKPRQKPKSKSQQAGQKPPINFVLLLRLWDCVLLIRLGAVKPKAKAKSKRQKPNGKSQKASQKRPINPRCVSTKRSRHYWAHFSPGNHELRCSFFTPLAELFPLGGANALAPQPP